MKSSIVSYFALQRRIFGICPNCMEFFRLSDCKVFLRTKPTSDWMDSLNTKSQQLDRAEEKLSEREEEIRMKAREKGRKEAQKQIRKVDNIFTPRKLNPDDAKVIFHPIDYLVFDGMNAGTSIKRIILLDQITHELGQKAIQRSIEKSIERGRCDWKTLVVKADGNIIEK